jgi:hypothetical protein
MMFETLIRFSVSDHVLKKSFNVNATTALDVTAAFWVRTLEIPINVGSIEIKQLFLGRMKVETLQLRSKRGDFGKRLLKGTAPPTKERFVCHFLYSPQLAYPWASRTDRHH